MALRENEEMGSVAAVVPGIHNPDQPAARNWIATSLLGAQKADTSVFDADAALVDRCLAGDDSAWEELVRVHTRRVYSICYRFTNREGDAQDLTQDVFLRVFKSLRSFRSGEGAFAVWLTRLTRNLLIDHYRRTKLERATDSLEDQLTVLEEKTATYGRTDSL